MSLEKILKGTSKTAERIAFIINLDWSFLHDKKEWTIVKSIPGIRNENSVHSNVWDHNECTEFLDALKFGLKDALIASFKDPKYRMSIINELEFIDDRIKLTINPNDIIETED